MTRHNANNERIKRKYFAYLKEAKRHSEATVDAAAKALDRFETYTKHRDFKAFRPEQAVAFKKQFAEQYSQKSGEKLSKATLYATLTQLKRFFQWLAFQPGYKSRFQYSDAEYFNLSDKDVRIATAQREQKAPTLEQVKHVINTMLSGTEIAWSQNLGHEKVLTTFTSYGEVACDRQGEIIRKLGTARQGAESTFSELAKAIAKELRQVQAAVARFNAN